MNNRYQVTLSNGGRKGLQSLVSVGKAAARKRIRRRILLLADETDEGPAPSDPEIVDTLGCGQATVERVRSMEFVEEGFEETLHVIV